VSCSWKDLVMAGRADKELPTSTVKFKRWGLSPHPIINYM